MPYCARGGALRRPWGRWGCLTLTAPVGAPQVEEYRILFLFSGYSLSLSLLKCLGVLARYSFVIEVSNNIEQALSRSTNGWLYLTTFGSCTSSGAKFIKCDLNVSPRHLPARNVEERQHLLYRLRQLAYGNYLFCSRLLSTLNIDVLMVSHCANGEDMLRQQRGTMVKIFAL